MDFKIKRKSSLHAKKPIIPTSAKHKQTQNQTQQDTEIQDIIKRIQSESEQISTPTLTNEEKIVQQKEDVQHRENLLLKAKLLVNKAKKEGTLEKALKLQQNRRKMIHFQQVLKSIKNKLKLLQMSRMKKQSMLMTVMQQIISKKIVNLKISWKNQGFYLKYYRRLIKKTKSNITDYVGELYTLNGKVQECNGYFKEIGQNHDEEIFQEFNTTFNQFIPGGKKNQLFKK